VFGQRGFVVFGRKTDAQTKTINLLVTGNKVLNYKSPRVGKFICGGVAEVLGGRIGGEGGGGQPGPGTREGPGGNGGRCEGLRGPHAGLGGVLDGVGVRDGGGGKHAGMT